MDQLKQVFTTPDGQTFDTRAEAKEHLRLPKIQEALEALTGENAELVEWLVTHKDELIALFDIGTIRRVSKSEKNKLRKALDHIVDLDDPKLKFVAENADAIHETFRYPSQKRMDDDEKAAAVAASLESLTDGNEEVSNWVATNRAKILEAYEAGKEKREVSPKAKAALEDYRAKQKAAKDAKEAKEAKEAA
jgi:hypothetical protein